MPHDLRRAHEALDRVVDRLYRVAAFSSDRERVEHLFSLYERLVAPLTAAAQRGILQTVLIAILRLFLPSCDEW
jgi:hypothetical protein